MKKFFLAWQFLTIFPVKIKDIKEPELGQSLTYFPLVGAIIGLISVFSLFVFSAVFPHQVANVLVLIVLICITGGIHLDGFVDTCDGFCAGTNDQEKILEIMRDSHLGAMGAMGLIGILLLKFTLLEGFPLPTLWKYLLAMCILGRWAQVLACFVSNYARETGKAESVIKYAGKRELFISSLLSLTLLIFLVGFQAIILFSILVPTLLYLIKYFRKRIGGMTGDTIGAINEVTEIAVLLFGLILVKI